MVIYDFLSEFLRMKKNPSVLRACRITTQKFLYFLVFLASILRGTYFAAPVRITTVVIIRKETTADISRHCFQHSSIVSLVPEHRCARPATLGGPRIHTRSLGLGQIFAIFPPMGGIAVGRNKSWEKSREGGGGEKH